MGDGRWKMEEAGWHPAQPPRRSRIVAGERMEDKSGGAVRLRSFVMSGRGFLIQRINCPIPVIPDSKILQLGEQKFFNLVNKNTSTW